MDSQGGKRRGSKLLHPLGFGDWLHDEICIVSGVEALSGGPNGHLDGGGMGVCREVKVALQVRVAS